MQDFCVKRGLVHQTTCPHTPEQNGVAERKNRYILEITRAFLIESKIPKSFWPEAIATAVYLMNRLPTHILNFKTPLEIFSQQLLVPSSLNLEPKVFGCTVFVHIPKPERSKCSPCAIKCVFLGYGKTQKGYRCYDPETRNLYTTMNCDFVEGDYFYGQSSRQGESQPENTATSDSLDWLLPRVSLPIPSPKNQSQRESSGQREGSLLPIPNQVTDVGPPEIVSGTAGQPNSSVQNVEPSNALDTSPSFSGPEVISYDNSIVHLDTSDIANNDRQEEIEGEIETLGVDGDTGQYEMPKRSTRGVPPKRYSPDWKGRKTKYSLVNVAQGQLTEMARAFEAALYEEEEVPHSFEEAMKHKHWRDAMKKEIDALIKNGTWENCYPKEKKQ